MVRKSLAVLTVTVVVATLGGCGREARPQQGQPVTTAATPATDFAAALQKRVTADAMMAHLKKLQEIANANDGNRALGTPGYDASVDYVANTLRDKGFDVQTPEFEVHLPFADEPTLTVGGDKVDAKPLEFTKGTPPEGVSGPLVAARVEDTPGCTASDYDGLPAAGAVVLVDRGKCPFGAKQTVAAERGAVALVVANNEDGDEMGGTLGEQTDVKIPVVSVTKATGERLRGQPGTTTLKLNAGVRNERTRNVIVQTKTGSTANVVMVGAHLDSVPDGPGINDNGSGVAALLETALQLGNSPQVTNAVRFGFFGAEELGLLGSNNYVQSLNVEALKDIP
ncbi:MAG TPA: M28 family peptidase, partial [Mycobacterium sp.]|nr:M28 family peptidase [Mycobacterium sp.]